MTTSIKEKKLIKSDGQMKIYKNRMIITLKYLQNILLIIKSLNSFKTGFIVDNYITLEFMTYGIMELLKFLKGNLLHQELPCRV